ncbi:MAG: hypothetical protein FGM16_04435 [Flavobacterium sp.]|nr:hypothetical protein [Flavobacterium sp.]
MKTKILGLVLVCGLTFIGCQKEDLGSVADEAKINAKIDLANDDVSDVVENAYDATATNANGRGLESATSQNNLPACATVTRNPAFGTAVQVGQTVTKTIDFGTVGCPMANGNVLKGQIIVTFVYQPTAASQTINYEFVNFYHNDIKIEGNKNFTRTFEQNLPVVVMNMDLTATFPDGRMFDRVGTRTRKIIAGYNTPLNFYDNIYEVTGNWTTTYPNLPDQISTITSPLLVKISCAEINKPLIVQGVITFQRGTRTSTLNYGSGDCDNLAVFTINGNAYNIIIGNP